MCHSHHCHLPITPAPLHALRAEECLRHICLSLSNPPSHPLHDDLASIAADSPRVRLRVILPMGLRRNSFPVGTRVLHSVPRFWPAGIRGSQQNIPMPGSFHTFGASSILTWVHAQTTSLACPAHPGSLEITTRAFAVISDAEDPYLVNTANEPESSLAPAPLSTTRPLYL